MRFFKRGNRFPSQRARLVESPLGMFGAMQRNGDDKKLSWSLGCQSRNGLGQLEAETASCRADPVVLEGVNGFFHSAFVKAIGNGASEGGRGKAAGAADGYG